MTSVISLTNMPLPRSSSGSVLLRLKTSISPLIQPSYPRRLSSFAPRPHSLPNPADPSSKPVSSLPTRPVPSLPAKSVPSLRTKASVRTMASTTARRALTIDNINPHVRAAQYAVRGELATRAENYRATLQREHAADKATDHDGKSSGKATTNGHLPFDSVIAANIGNPQQLDQKPITFFRQVLSLLEYPALLDKPEILTRDFGYPSDVLERAKWLLQQVHSVGAYSQSTGSPAIRESVARFIERRDGYPSDSNNIVLSAGASSGVNTLMHIICASPESGVLVPIPQYPLYTATLSVLDARCVPYYLDEAHQWATDLSAMREALQQARQQGTDVRALVVINPGNPTGASLSADAVRNVIQFAAENQLVVLADEVYQTNVFQGSFTSFKRGLRDLQKEHPGGEYEQVELASLHSCSKGMVGECGHRGGYFELVGFDPAVAAQINKFVSIQLCAPVIGQCLVELMVNPPQKGDPSFELYDQEYHSVFRGLKERALALWHAFEKMEGVECEEPQGSMYLFPQIRLPQRAVEQAQKESRKADEFYCLRLLDATGVCVVPGSGFGQKPGTWHFRTTFLAPGTEWVGRITRFHKEFMDEFRDP